MENTENMGSLTDVRKSQSPSVFPLPKISNQWDLT